jgi:hypothetical protein
VATIAVTGRPDLTDWPAGPTVDGWIDGTTGEQRNNDKEDRDGPGNL